MRVPLYDPRSDLVAIEGRLDRVIRDVIDSGIYVLGSQVEAFEKEFAGYCGTKYAVGVGSGTAALELTLHACGIGEGDEVITVPNTDIATTAPITRCGAKIVFVDVERHSLVMDPKEIERKITPRTKALLPVHLFGQPVAMTEILDIAASGNLLVIEDAALAVGAEYRGRKAGTMGDAGFMSLAPNKILGGLGNAGVVVTDRSDLAEKLLSLRDDGKANSIYHHVDRSHKPRLVEYECQGFNERPDEIQAAVLRVKLNGLEDNIERRRAIAAKYGDRLQSLNVTLPEPPDDVRHAYRAYTILVENRDGLADHLEERGIETAVYYAPPLHLQRPYRSMNHRKGDFPITEEVAEKMLSLPVHPTLSDEQIEFVIDAVIEFVSES